jgi:hypothetical protein
MRSRQKSSGFLGLWLHDIGTYVHQKGRRAVRMMNRDAIEAELLAIEHTLQDERLTQDAKFALMGASQALRNMLDPETLAARLADVLSPGCAAQ